MGAEAEGQSYYFGPLQKSSALGGMSWFQVAVIATCGALGVGLMRSLPSAPGMVVGLGLLGLGFAMGFVRIGGRLVEDWAFPVRYWYSRPGPAGPALGTLRRRRGRAPGNWMRRRGWSISSSSPSAWSAGRPA